MDKFTTLTIRHFPDRQKACICLEQGNQVIVIATIRNKRCEKLFREFLGDDTDGMISLMEEFNAKVGD